jgi:hypothetical protein
MVTKALAVATLLACGLLPAAASFAANTGTSAVTLAASATAVLEILDATLTLAPNATDYTNDFVELTAASGLRVRLKTNSSTGCVLSVRCADASPQIALADLRVRTQTAAGAGGTRMSAYTAITAANQLLWSTGAAQSAWLTVTTDVRVQNLMAYADAIGAGLTSYTDNLTYTVVTQ